MAEAPHVEVTACFGGPVDDRAAVLAAQQVVKNRGKKPEVFIS
jgi:hypothetical protein